jgi:hypothetical protein
MKRCADLECLSNGSTHALPVANRSAPKRLQRPARLVIAVQGVHQQRRGQGGGSVRPAPFRPEAPRDAAFSAPDNFHVCVRISRCDH